MISLPFSIKANPLSQHTIALPMIYCSRWWAAFKFKTTHCAPLSFLDTGRVFGIALVPFTIIL